MSQTLAAIIFLAMAAVIVVTNSLSRRHFIFLCGFVTPLLVPGLSVGINILWYNIIGGAALVLLPLSNMKRKNGRHGIESREVKVLIIYAVIISTVWLVFEYTFLERYITARLIGLSDPQTLYKIPVQTLSFVFQLLAFYIVLTRARDTRQTAAAHRGLLAGLALSIIAGLASTLLTGRGMVGTERLVEVELGDTSLVRLGGLSGEPKMLGAFLVISILFVIARLVVPAVGTKPRGRRGLIFAAFLAFALFSTFSTSAWAGIVAGTGVIGVVQALATKTNWMRWWAFASLLMLILWQVPVARVAFDTRFEDRLLDQEKAQLDRSKDNYVFDVYKKKPWFILTGFGLGGLDLEATPLMLHDPKYKAELQYVRTPTPSTNGMRLLGDIGLIGLALMGLMVRRWYKELRAVGHLSGALFVLSGFVALMFISWNAISTYFFLAGAVLAEGRIMQRQREVDAARQAQVEDSPVVAPVVARQVA